MSKEQMMNKTSITALARSLSLGLAAGTVLAQARGPWAMNQGNTWGYSIMTQQERTDHQTRMRSFKTYDECKAYEADHHKQMEARAKERGTTMPPMGKGNYGCDNLKAMGYLK